VQRVVAPGFHSRSLFKCMDLEKRILTEGACSDQMRKAVTARVIS